MPSKRLEEQHATIQRSREERRQARLRALMLELFRVNYAICVLEAAVRAAQSGKSHIDGENPSGN